VRVRQSFKERPDGEGTESSIGLDVRGQVTPVSRNDPMVRVLKGAYRSWSIAHFLSFKERPDGEGTERVLTR